MERHRRPMSTDPPGSPAPADDTTGSLRDRRSRGSPTAARPLPDPPIAWRTARSEAMNSRSRSPGLEDDDAVTRLEKGLEHGRVARHAGSDRTSKVRRDHVQKVPGATSTSIGPPGSGRVRDAEAGGVDATVLTEAGAGDGEGSTTPSSVGVRLFRNAPTTAVAARAPASRSDAARRSSIGERVSARPVIAAAVTRVAWRQRRSRPAGGPASASGSCRRPPVRRRRGSPRARSSSRATSGASGKSIPPDATSTCSCSWITTAPPRGRDTPAAARAP